MEASINREVKHGIKKKYIHLLALGGTISSVAKSPTDEFYHGSSAHIDELLSKLPIDYQKITVKSEQMLQQISQDMTFDELVLVAKKINALVNDDSIDGVVVTQGTNSIEETAYFINLVIKTKKSIVFTGSYRPSNVLGFDGGRNLYNAILLAASNKTQGLGVILTFNDCIVNAREASKFNPSIPGNFSLEAGGIGYIQGNEVFIQKIPHGKHTYCSEFDINKIDKEPKIYLIYGHLGMDSSFVNVAIEQNVMGIISAGMGKGYQPKEVTESLICAAKKGIVVVRCSRTGQGVVNKEPNFDDRHGFIAGGSLSPQKARILLLVAVSKTQNRAKIQQFFDEY